MNVPPPATPAKALVGLTGGIASGKSTVCEMLRALGVAVVNADTLAREVVAPGSEGLQAIAAEFGDGFIAADGTLNREKLGRHIFANPDARQALNAITHPRVAALASQRFAELALTATPYVVYDVPLLIETGLHQAVASVVVVAAPEATQLARIQERDGLDQEAAKARIRAQLPLEKKLEVADFVLHNDDTLEALREQVHALHRALLARHSTPE